MKRINPQTNQPFRRYDTREDGYSFFGYSSHIKSNGYFKEIWLNPNSSRKIQAKDKDRKRSTYQRRTDRKPPGYWKLSLEQRAEYDVSHYGTTE